jgi:hypothetical protein
MSDPAAGMPAPSDLHREHVFPLDPAHERIRWLTPLPHLDRVRVRRRTCSCGDVLFELCEAGGSAFIRRLEISMNKVVVHESSRLPTARAVHLWQRLRRGQAC